MKTPTREHGLDDNAIAQTLSIVPRQDRQLDLTSFGEKCLLQRKRDPTGKIVNELLR